MPDWPVTIRMPTLPPGIEQNVHLVSGNNRQPGRSVLSKGFAILSALRTAETGLTRPQLARRTGLPMTTVLRLATELRDMGALELDDHGTYRLGAWLWELGTLAASRSTLREVALPFMEDLYEATHENVQLAVRDGYDALIVERIRGPNSVPIVTRPGGRLPLHATGVGKALLAYEPLAFVDEVIDRGLPRLTPFTITDGDFLRRDLAQVRKRGHSTTKDEMTVGAVSVGAAIFGPEHQVVGAVSLVVASKGANSATIAPAVRAVANGLTRRVGLLWDNAEPRGQWALTIHPVDSRLVTRERDR
jgi:DNA-binding IclR family transcriptional regulator